MIVSKLTSTAQTTIPQPVRATRQSRPALVVSTARPPLNKSSIGPGGRSTSMAKLPTVYVLH